MAIEFETFLPGGFERDNNGLIGADAAVVSPDGRQVFVSSTTRDAVAVFDRDPNSGSLNFRTVFREGVDGVDGLEAAESIAISPDGKQIFVAGRDSDALAVFDRDIDSGSLTFNTSFKDGIDGIDGLEAAESVAISPDGSQIFVVGREDDALAVFERNANSGELTFNTTFKDNTNGVDGLDSPSSVTTSPDGRQIFVTSTADRALAVFDRDSSTGDLTFNTVFKDNTNGIDKLALPIAVAVSPDGRQVLVASKENALSIFDRDAISGELTFNSVLEGSSQGVGLPDDVTVSPDGKQVFVTSRSYDALSVLDRDPDSGELTFDTIFQEGAEGVEGLQFVSSVVISPDGKQVFTAGPAGLAVFDNTVVEVEKVSQFRPEEIEFYKTPKIYQAQPSGRDLLDDYRRVNGREIPFDGPRTTGSPIVVSDSDGADDVIGAFSGEDDITVDGQAGSDYIFGNQGDNLLLGGLGDDILAGFGGQDRIVGGAGADVMSGGSNDDILTGIGATWSGGFEDDILYGGQGGDRFDLVFQQQEYTGQAAKAKIMDFDPNAGDKFGIAEDFAYGDLLVRWNGEATELIDLRGLSESVVDAITALESGASLGSIDGADSFMNNVIAEVYSPGGRGDASNFTELFNSQRSRLFEFTTGIAP